jgi:hypothetical protein
MDVDEKTLKKVSITLKFGQLTISWCKFAEQWVITILHFWEMSLC